ncbi:hypothetical protein NIES267_44360 [Calothrix parasitica NIES-267]|uniref:Lipopolysaccharide assembly protein A domain-containing protein n=1 Tax=Calothrix parasitica NIES-267 TaxID=1973488 RepID=A0A1Z4LV36_9CYAN|nr:hypothetical protein NIES267_44360 [Calothrix parasitica NIES-267]
MFKKVVLPTVAISGIIFIGFAVLLGQYSSERIEIQLENQSFFFGEVRDIVSPGMGVAFALMLGVGGISVIGYSESTAKLKKLEKQLSSIQKTVLDKDVRIAELRRQQQIDNLEFVEFSRR